MEVKIQTNEKNPESCPIKTPYSSPHTSQQSKLSIAFSGPQSLLITLERDLVAMGLGYTEEIVSKVAAARIFEAGAVDMHNLAPKILPDMVAGCKILQGDGGAGTIKQIDFTEGADFCFVNFLLIKCEKNICTTVFPRKASFESELFKLRFLSL